MYRINRYANEHIIDVDQVEAIEPSIRSTKPGRYQVDQISAEPLPSSDTSRRRGLGVKRPNRSVVLLSDPGPESTVLA